MFRQHSDIYNKDKYLYIVFIEYFFIGNLPLYWHDVFFIEFPHVMYKHDKWIILLYILQMEQTLIYVT